MKEYKPAFSFLKNLLAIAAGREAGAGPGFNGSEAIVSKARLKLMRLAMF